MPHWIIQSSTLQSPFIHLLNYFKISIIFSAHSDTRDVNKDLIHRPLENSQSSFTWMETNVSRNDRPSRFHRSNCLGVSPGLGKALPRGWLDQGTFTGSDWNMSSNNSQAAGHPSDNMVSLYMKTTRTQSQWCESTETRFNHNHPPAAGSVQPVPPTGKKSNSCCSVDLWLQPDFLDYVVMYVRHRLTGTSNNNAPNKAAPCAVVPGLFWVCILQQKRFSVSNLLLYHHQEHLAPAKLAQPVFIRSCFPKSCTCSWWWFKS